MAKIYYPLLNITDDYLIFAYIHNRIESKYKIKIPKELIFLLILFYTPKAEWDTKLKYGNIQILDNQCIKVITDNSWATIFGERIISKYGKYEWIIKVIECKKKTGWNCVIGIIRNSYCQQFIDEHNTNVSFVPSSTQAPSIGFIDRLTSIIGGGSIKKYGDKSYTFGAKGDQLKMILDLDNHTLSYIINGKDYGNVDVGNFYMGKYSQYRLGVSIYKGIQIQLCQPDKYQNLLQLH